MKNIGNIEYNQKRNIVWLSENEILSLTDQAAFMLHKARNIKSQELGRKLNSAENREVFNNVILQIVNQYSNLKNSLREVKIALGTRLSERAKRKIQDSVWDNKKILEGDIRKTVWEQQVETASNLHTVLTDNPSNTIFSPKQIQRMKIDSLNVIRARHGDPKD